MKSEFRRRTKVKPEGHIEVSVPEIAAGETVEVVIHAETQSHANGKRPGFGGARGLIKMTEDFDAPLSEFTDYQ